MPRRPRAPQSQRPDPRLLAALRGRPLPEAPQPFDGGSFEKPALHIGRVDADGTIIVQVLVGHVVATSAELSVGPGLEHTWLDRLHTLDGYRRRGLARFLVRHCLAASDEVGIVIAVEPRIFGAGGPDMEQVIAWLLRLGFGRVHMGRTAWLLHSPPVRP